MLASTSGRRPAIEFSANPGGDTDISGPSARPEGSRELVARVCGFALLLSSMHFPCGGPALPPVTSHLQAN